MVKHRSVVDEHLFVLWELDSDATFSTRCDLVAKTNVRERSAHHHFVVSTSRSVTVEVLSLYALLGEVDTTRHIGANVSSRRDVVSSY